MLGIGAVASLYFLFKYKPFVLDWNAAPLILMYCLPVWVLIHYCFFAQEPDLQWLEIKSLWVRVVAGMLIATAMGVLIRKPDRINSVFIFAFFGMSISIMSVYVFESFQLSRLLTPYEFYEKFLFDRNKINNAFFSVLGLAIGCASILYSYSSFRAKNYVVKSLVIFFLMTLCFSASVITDSKNGVGIGLILISIFLLNFLILLIRVKNQARKIYGTLLISILAVIFSLLFAIHKDASPGWETLFYDVQTAVQINQYQRWRGPEASGEQYPKNNLGLDVSRNTYERFAFMTAGTRELMKHPLGYGLINHPSFPRWLKKDGINFDFQSSTHAGWVDFGLAFGFPAVLILFAAIFAVMIITFINKSYTDYLVIWIVASIFILGFVQEITFKHTFEAAIFVISFCSSCSAEIGKKLNLKNV